MVSIQLALPHATALISTDTQDMADMIKTVFAAMLRPCEGPSICDIEVLRRGDQYGLRFCGKESPCASRLEVIFLVHWIIEQRVESLEWNDRIVFHGGLIRKQDRAFALVAPTRTGKSTLTASLCADDYEFYADDFICVHRETCRVLPFALPIVLRNLLPGIRNEILAEGFNPRREEYSYFVKTKEYADTTHPPLTHVLFLERGDTNALIQLSKGASYLALLQNLKDAKRLEREVFFLKEFCGRVKCFSLRFRDRDFEYVKEAVGGLA